MRKISPAFPGLALLLVSFVFLGCGPTAIVSPPDRLVGPFAFADETGRVSLGVSEAGPKGSLARALRAIDGTLAVRLQSGEIEYISAIGSFDDSTGWMTASAIGEVDGLSTTYEVEGTYIPGTGFSGTITRTRDGQTSSGTVAVLADESGDMEIRVFTGVFGGVRTIESWTSTVLLETQPSGDPQEVLNDLAWDLDGDDGMGSFCITCSEEVVFGMYRNAPDYDEEEESGVVFGSFTDSPANSQFRLLVKGLIFADGTIDADHTNGTWYEQTWQGPYFIEGDNLWRYQRTTIQGTFSGDLLE